MEQKGMLIVLSGFSGAGKGTVVKELTKDDNYRLSVSATTRKPRPGETHGKDYFFISKEEFEDMIRKNELLEHAQYVENYYGTPRNYVQSQLDQGYDVILEIEMIGALNVKTKFPEAVLLFVTPPNAKLLRDRLTGRGTEDDTTVAKRLARASEEVEFMDKYDYIVVNDDLQTCVNEVKSIIVASRNKATNNINFINNIKYELNEIAKGVN
ncbi:MAG: guanylate kinase [Clostridiales bacterium]|jgi:guanylate kinase|nr:guanylate kinase [Clostridiales bacterium]